MSKRCDLVYGKSASGKTTWCLAIAEAMAKQGLKTRWYLGDGGLETIDASGMIEDGWVEVMLYKNWPFPFETTSRICAGWWPESPATPGSPLRPPRDGELAKYGLFVYEGISVMCDYMAGDVKGGLRQRNAVGEKIKEASVSFKDGEMTFGTLSSANFGTVQEQIITRIEETYALPGMTIWTAHETLAEDKKKLGPREGTGPIISAGVEYGPDVFGQAMTPVIGASFGNTIHLHPAITTITKKEVDPVTKKPMTEVVVRHRAYTRRHLDPQLHSQVAYYANNRMPPAFADLMPDYLEKPDPIRFYEILAEGKRKAREARSATLAGTASVAGDK